MSKISSSCPPPPVNGPAVTAETEPNWPLAVGLLPGLVNALKGPDVSITVDEAQINALRDRIGASTHPDAANDLKGLELALTLCRELPSEETLANLGAGLTQLNAKYPAPVVACSSFSEGGKKPMELNPSAGEPVEVPEEAPAPFKVSSVAP